MSTRAILSFASLAACVILLGAGSCTKPAEAGCEKAAPECLPTELTLTDSLGQQYTPEMLKGKVVVVNFWAMWCKPCTREIPAFSRVYERYKDRGVLMFGVLQEDAANTELLNFASDYEMTYPIVHIEEDIARKFGLADSIPTTFIYDKTGRRKVNRVGELREQELQSYLDELLR
jgi:thiol-disulfide isomerase/thioredoxin